MVHSPRPPARVWTDLLCCPRCRSALLPSRPDEGAAALSCANPACPYAMAGFPAVQGTPVLVDFDRSILSRDAVLASGAAPTKTRTRSRITRLRRRLTSPKGPTADNARLFLDRLKTLTPHPRLLVIGGGVVGNGADILYQDTDISLIGLDIYRSDLVQIIADGHQLPLTDGAVDGVWIQAVLEHVLDPAVVVAEVHRVLRDDGLVYAETPFMYPVHEGAYDFIRFSLNGHRWLFRHFDEMAAGVTTGPSVMLIMAIRHWAAALLRNHKLGSAVATAFFWLRFLEPFLDPAYANDAASGVFFMGRKAAQKLSPAHIISYYRGAQ